MVETMEDKIGKITDDIMRSAQLAAALEVSGWPKPGNIHRIADFADTRFEHFIAGAIALGPSIREAALQGVRVDLGELQISEIGVGRYIKKAVTEVNEWHLGGNTNLGISLLFIPLAAAAGLTCIKIDRIENQLLRENLINIMKATTFQDSLDTYEAINSASSAALGRLEKEVAPDLTDQRAKAKLFEQGVTLYDAMKVSSNWDNIAKELATGMAICFETGYPTLLKVYKETKDINIATVHTFLTILSTFPDTLIARKIGVKETPYIERAVDIGIKKTKWITQTAEHILEIGGLTTDTGRNAIFDFDHKLRSALGEYNPGTSADLTAGSLMVALLCGLKF